MNAKSLTIIFAVPSRSFPRLPIPQCFSKRAGYPPFPVASVCLPEVVSLPKIVMFMKTYCAVRTRHWHICAYMYRYTKSVFMYFSHFDKYNYTIIHFFKFFSQSLEEKTLSFCKLHVKQATFPNRASSSCLFCAISIAVGSDCLRRLASASNNTGRVCIKDSHGKNAKLCWCYADRERLTEAWTTPPLVVIIILYLIMICLHKKKTLPPH